MKDSTKITINYTVSQLTLIVFARNNINFFIFVGYAGSLDGHFIKHPRIMKKVQKELENIVGMDRMVE